VEKSVSLSSTTGQKKQREVLANAPLRRKQLHETLGGFIRKVEELMAQ
jgi:hypothetical protein